MLRLTAAVAPASMAAAAAALKAEANTAFAAGQFHEAVELYTRGALAATAAATHAS